MGPISIGMDCKTVHDVSMPVSQHRSLDTKFRPVLHVKTTCCHDIHIIEIQIPSTTTGNGVKLLGLNPEVQNRYVEELQFFDPDDPSISESCEHGRNSCVTDENAIESDERPLRRFHSN